LARCDAPGRATPGRWRAAQRPPAARAHGSRSTPPAPAAVPGALAADRSPV